MTNPRDLTALLAVALVLSACKPSESVDSVQPLPSVDARAAEAHSRADSEVVARIGDEVVTMAELDAFLMERLMRGVTGGYRADRLHSYRALGIERLVNERLLARAARREGLPPDAIREREIDEGPPIDAAQIRAAFELRRDLIGGLPYEEVEAVIREQLAARQLKRNEKAFYERLRREADSELLLRADAPTPGSSRPPAIARPAETEPTMRR